MAKTIIYNPIESLVLSYQGGDKTALKKLIKAFNPKIRSSIRFQAGINAPVDDISQESWYAIIDKIGETKFTIGFEVWALSIARRKAIDWIRAQRTNREVFAISEIVDSVDQIDEEAESHEDLLKKLRLEILRLPKTHQLMISMFYLQSYSIEEISQVLQIPVGTVKSRLFKAREYLKQTLNQKNKKVES
ncbi:MAG: sigma-70 family RNA polymerase sigma factor [Balneolaceae bacterium]|nr:sigma-70 family RNA polymerase sigma factor [Balneolaceae bacterium]